jgi:hypothetical protein
VRRWLAPVPHATVDRTALTRGPLPVRLDQPAVALSVPGPAATTRPVGQPFWVREGIGTLQWRPTDLGNRSYSLVVMRPDGRADLALDLRAEVRPGWLAPAPGGLLGGGVLLVALALLALLRPVRPREVVFVVEPDRVRCSPTGSASARAEHARRPQCGLAQPSGGAGRRAVAGGGRFRRRTAPAGDRGALADRPTRLLTRTADPA